MNKADVSYYYQVTTPQVEILAADGAPASPELLYQALHDEDPEVQVSAALGLVRLGDLSTTVINPLFQAADWRNDPEASSTARSGIVELAQINPALSDLLVAALQDEQMGLTGVAECLGAIGQRTPAVIDGLRHCAHRSQQSDPYAAVSAAHSLLQLGDEGKDVVNLLLTLRRQGDWVVRSVALQALCLLQPPPPAVLELLLADAQKQGSNQPDAKAQLAAIDPNDPRWEEAFVETAGPAWMTRLEALRGLAAITDPTPAVLEILCAALADSEWVMRREAVQSLGKLGKATPLVIDSLLALLTKEEQKEQPEAAAAMPPPSLAEDDRNLRTRLTEWQTSQSLRGDVALTLAQLGYSNDRVVAAFLAELENRDASVRERIVRNWWLLGKHNSAVLAPLQAALQDEAEAVRQSAAASLHRLNHGERKSGN